MSDSELVAVGSTAVLCDNVPAGPSLLDELAELDKELSLLLSLLLSESSDEVLESSEGLRARFIADVDVQVDPLTSVRHYPFARKQKKHEDHRKAAAKFPRNEQQMSREGNELIALKKK